MKPPPPSLHTHPPFTGDSERDLPGGLDGKASAYNLGDLGSIPGSGRSPGEGKGNPLQYSCLENPMGGGAWWATVHGVKKGRTRLSDFTSHTIKWASLIAQLVKNPPAMQEIPGLRRSPGAGKGYPCQYSDLENFMDCSLPGSSIHGIFQATVLEWVAISFSRRSSHPGIEPRSPTL